MSELTDRIARALDDFEFRTLRRAERLWLSMTDARAIAAGWPDGSPPSKAGIWWTPICVDPALEQGEMRVD